MNSTVLLCALILYWRRTHAAVYNSTHFIVTAILPSSPFHAIIIIIIRMGTRDGSWLVNNVWIEDGRDILIYCEPFYHSTPSVTLCPIHSPPFSRVKFSSVFFFLFVFDGGLCFFAWSVMRVVNFIYSQPWITLPRDVRSWFRGAQRFTAIANLMNVIRTLTLYRVDIRLYH